MYRIMIECTNLNCDKFVIQMIENIKRMQQEGMLQNLPAGIKIPSFFNAGMYQALSQQQRLALVTQGINQEKKRLMPMLEKKLEPYIGKIVLSDMMMQTDVGAECEALFQLDVARTDSDKMIDLLVERVLEEKNIPEMLGQNYDHNLNTENIAYFMHGQNQETKEYLVLKTMSVEKSKVIEYVTQYALAKDIVVSIKNIKFMLKEM